jgi:hypothetical protein
MFNYIKSKISKKNTSWIVSETAKVTCIFRASVCMEGMSLQ